MQGGNWKTGVELPAGRAVLSPALEWARKERGKVSEATGLKATQVNTQNHATKTQEQIQVTQLSEKRRSRRPYLGIKVLK